MKNVSWAINFLLPVFFLADLWIIIYTKLNDYLYFLFPPKLTEVFYRNGLGNPEPFEISLYIVLTIFFVLLILLFYRFRNYFTNILNNHFWIKVTLLLFFTILFITTLGTFPLKGDVFPYQTNHSSFEYFIFSLVYLGFISLVIFETIILKKIFKTKFSALLHCLVFLLLLIVTFLPRFSIPPIEGSLFYGPAFEVAKGKTLFTEIPSQYGFLSILLFALFYKLIHINFIYLPILIWIFTAVEYYLCFYLIFDVSKSSGLSLLGLFSILTVNYFGGTFGPQGGALRWLPIFLLMLLFLKIKKLDSLKLIAILPFLIFWNIDSGIFLTLGYLLTLFLFWLSGKINFKNFLITNIRFALTIVLFIILLQTTHLALGYKLIDFLQLYHSVQKNAVVGMLMVPIENQTYFWIVVLIYFASIIYFFSNKTIFWQVAKVEGHPDDAQRGPIPQRASAGGLLSRAISVGKPLTESAKNDRNLSELILLSANLMLFASIYYVGRSMPHELITVSIFPILTFFLLSVKPYNELNSAKLHNLTLVLIFLCFVVFPFWQRKEYISEKLISRFSSYLSGNLFSSELDQTLTDQYKNESALINRLQNQEVVIISADNTYLHYLTGKKNLLHANPAFAIDTVSEMQFALKSVLKICPKEIVTDCTYPGKCANYKVMTERLPGVGQIQKEIEQKCGLQFTSTACNGKLCLLRAK